MPDAYDPRSAVQEFAPGCLLTRDIEAALFAQWASNGHQPLTSDQVIAITGTPPAFPSTMVWVDPNFS